MVHLLYQSLSYILYVCMSTEQSSQLAARVVLSFDIGTSYSGISYSILDPRISEHEVVRRVDNFQAQEGSNSTRTPTVLWYNSQGSCRSVGDAAVTRGVERQAEERDWTKVERMKLYVHHGDSSSVHLPDLPANVIVEDMLADYIEYLYDAAKAYILANHNIDLSDLKGRVRYVLPLPNGWDNVQQQQVRRAVATAGLVDSERSPDLILITEAEAQLNYCVKREDFTFPDTDGVIMVSAGSAISNFSAYSKIPDGQFYQEVVAAQSVLCGSSLVTDELRGFLKHWFRDCRFSDDVDAVAENFDKAVKLQFDNEEIDYHVQFASPRDNDPDLMVHSGALELHGRQIAEFFKPSGDTVLSEIEEIRGVLNGVKPITSIVLVGGFAESNWLFNKIWTTFSDCVVYRPQGDMLNAIADGAIHFYLYHYITMRITRYTYGVRSNIKFNPSDPEHQAREASKEGQYDGKMVLPNAFDILLPKNTQVRETKEYRRSYQYKSLTRQGLFKRSVQLLCYKGSQETPKWTDMEPELFEPIQVLEADLSTVAKSLTPMKDSAGRTYFVLKHDVILAFGPSGINARTEVQAQIGWSVTKRFRNRAKVLHVPLHENYGSV
ncbi:hypothetical protein JOM56_002871 [Amanita muscaria]